ncbi:J domain-containing protein required for chloroplast accumulation [Salix suchowensis]|nr:J domain-containing protein required for chloroplast accumulation [Salix suchowensis]
MERFSQRESVLLGYNLQRQFINHPSSSSNSQYGNSDIDFTDVFGGPPRRSSLQEVRSSFAETTDSFVSRNGDVDTKLSRNSLSSLNEKSVFGDENVNRRRYPRNDFFDDIFRGNESLSSSPRKHDRDPLSSTPGSRVLSPAGLLPPRVDPWNPSLPAKFSLPAKLSKRTNLPTFNIHKNKDGASYGASNYAHSPLSRSAIHTDHSTLSKELSLSSEESSNSTKHEETDTITNLKSDSDSSNVPTNGNRIPFAMSLQGATKSRLEERCKLQRCSSANGLIVNEGIARELRSETPHDIDAPSFSSHLELNQQDNRFLFSKSIQGYTIFHITGLDTPSTHQVIVEDGPGYSVLEASIEIKHHYAPEMNLSEKTKEGISVVTNEDRKTELKPLRSLLSQNYDEQRTDEITRKTGLKESTAKCTKNTSAVFHVSENVGDQDEKRTTENKVEVDKAVFQLSRDSLEKNRLRGKVKEFVKIFNQKSSGRKERRKFKTDDTTNEKMHSRNVNNRNKPDASILVNKCLEQSEKQHPETKANNLRSEHVSSGRKDSSASTAAYIPGGLKSTIADTDMSFPWYVIIIELAKDEGRELQTSDNHDEVQVIDDKIQKWSKGKEGNIRSLLSTLQYVSLWSGSGWNPVPLVNIIERNAVKRTYQKALLCLHPDKLQQKGATSHQKYTAEKVFDILQESWTHFNTLGEV